jgi:hypothetical protein
MGAVDGKINLPRSAEKPTWLSGITTGSNP